MPDIGIPQAEINTRIKLLAPDGWNTFEQGDDMSLVVDIYSDDQIQFTYDFGARMFMLEDQEWVEVQNSVRYPSGSFVLSPSEGNLQKTGAVVLDPVIPQTDHSVLLRVFVIGNIYSNDQVTDEKTATYIDLELNP